MVCFGEVRVNESLLTGESEEILKKEGDFLLSGSFVTAGKCHAKLEKVGDESYISKLTLKAKTMREGEQSEMIRSLDSVTAMVAAVIGMIPEGLYLLATMALTVSSIRLASGSEAAMQVSQVVLLESDFSRMPEVVAEGRRVVNNIQQSASLFLVKNIFSFLLALISIGFVFKYPLEPSQISLVAMFTIGIPGFFLSLQPNEKRITGNFLANVLLKALPAGITDALLVASLSYFGIVFQVGEADISTAATMLLAIVGFMILYQICKPMNPVRGGICAGCIVGIIGTSLLFPLLLGINAMSQKCIMLLILFSVATEPVLRYLTRLNEGIQRLYKKRSKQKAMCNKSKKRNIR